MSADDAGAGGGFPGQRRVPPLKADVQQVIRATSTIFCHCDGAGYLSLRVHLQSKDSGNKPIRTSMFRLDDQIGARVAAAANMAANHPAPAFLAVPTSTFRTNVNAKTVNAREAATISADFDTGNPAEALAKAEKVLGPATLVVETGGITDQGHAKLHAHWRLKVPAQAADGGHKKLADARARLALLCDGDRSAKSIVQPFRWPGSWHRKDDANPKLTTIVTFNPDAEVDLDTALAALVAVTGKRAKVDKGKPQAPLERLLAALAAINNDGEGVDYDTWFRILCGIHHATKAAGYDIARDWSARSDKFDEAKTQKTWGGINPDHPNPVTAGTIFKIAREEYGWVDDGGDGRPVIKIFMGALHLLADQAENAILKSGLPVFQRGLLVRPAVTELDAADGGKTQIAALHALGVAYLLDLFCRTAAWKRWSDFGGWVASDPPENVAKILLARAGQWRLPQLRGILGIPTLRRDGSLLLTPGYDPASGYYLALPPELRLPAISDEPERSECVAALKLLDDLLVEFPFVDDASRSVGLSLLITAVIRPSMIVAPVHAASSPTRGTGKSFLFDLAAGVVYGDRCPVVFAGKGPEELEKKLNGQLLQGTGLFSLDNLNIALEGDLICQVATQALLDLRRLDKSDIFRTPNSALLCACGNNLAVHDDLNRRVVMAWMDAGVERPELRAFEADPFATVIQDRGKYIAAVLTIVRGYLAVQRFDGVDLTPLAGFDQYTRLVREPLVWLGRADPARSMDALHAADRVLNELISVMAAWEGAVGLNQEITVAAVLQGIASPPIPKRETRPDLTLEAYRTLITDIAARWTDLGAAIAATSDYGGKVTAAMLGYWLRRYSKRITNGRKFMSRAGHGGVMHWWLAG